MISELLAIFERETPHSLKSIHAARAADPALFDALGEKILASMRSTFPHRNLSDLVEAYAMFMYELNRLQAVYEKTGKYPMVSHAEADRAVYQNSAMMTDYVSTHLLSQFLWPQHLEIIRFFCGRFIPLLPDDARVLEMAPGHGLFGRLILENKPHAQLLGVDISPHVIEVASQLARNEGLDRRAVYRQGDVLAPERLASDSNVVIAGELLEHLDQPALLIEAISRQLAKGGFAFITAAITAANVDHVYEFKTPDEVLVLVSAGGLKVVDKLLVSAPVGRGGLARTPRVLSMIATH